MSNLAEFIKSLSAYEFEYASRYNNVKTDVHITDRLSDLFVDYKKEIEKISACFFRNFGYEKDDCVAKTDTICNEIIDICKLYQQGDIAAAIQKLYSLYFENENLVLTSIKADTDMYRMRSADKNRLFSENEMFHVPFELNYLLKNERYSISGFPSLYLGSSTYFYFNRFHYFVYRKIY